MRSLEVVVLLEGLGDGFRLLQISRPIQGQAFLLRGAVEAFDKAILLGMMRITDVNLNAQTRAKTNQSGREVTARWTADPTRITIQGDASGGSHIWRG
jgi:hypothetical protein